MKPSLPICCSPTAYQFLQHQVAAIDSPDALLNGAVAISMHQMENIDPAVIDATLQSYVDIVRSRVRGCQPQAMLAHLHEFLFEEIGFVGDTEDYYNPLNSYMPAVLDRKRGLPITLSLIYRIVAERLGMKVWGVGLPGHFLVGMETGGSTTLIDPFSRGRLLTPEQAFDRMKEAFGTDVAWSDDLLQPASNRHWLTRILQNLLHLYNSKSHYADVAAILEMEMILWPSQNHLQRDLALVLARIGLSRPASQWLDMYLKNNPDDPQQTDLRQLLEVLSA